MNKEAVKLIALDLDGTLTQHRSPLEEENRRVLDALREKYSLLIVGAGGCRRIHRQMRGYPIDIIGNYGMEVSVFNPVTGEVDIIESHRVEPDRESVLKRAAEIRQKFGYTHYVGESVEFHDSGMITFALLGTGAAIEDKLAFDPTREKRRAIYSKVMEVFPEYTVFVGGTSSFDMAPAPFNKLYALDRYCSDHGLTHQNMVFFGDDWEPGGGDHQVYTSDIPFIVVDNYLSFREKASFLVER